MSELGTGRRYGCHVCGELHGTAHYFSICSPKYQYQLEMERRTEELREAARLASVSSS